MGAGGRRVETGERRWRRPAGIGKYGGERARKQEAAMRLDAER